jgi:DNA-binding HxlR family transcriptional regulator
VDGVEPELRPDPRDEVSADGKGWSSLASILAPNDEVTTPAESGDDRAPAPGARTRSPVEITAGLLRGRWTAPILWHLFWGGKSFYQLLREVEGITRPALAHELDEMERVGLVRKRVDRGGPPRVEYVLTGLGESLKPVLGVMYQWGLEAMGRAFGDKLAVEKQRRCARDEH